MKFNSSFGTLLQFKTYNASKVKHTLYKIVPKIPLVFNGI